MKYYSSSLRAEDIFFSPDLSAKVLNEFITSLSVITQFCRKERVALQRVEKTNEKGYEEVMLVFNNDLGGYTMNGIRSSLSKEKNGV